MPKERFTKHVNTTGNPNKITTCDWLVSNNYLGEAGLIIPDWAIAHTKLMLYQPAELGCSKEHIHCLGV
jgi:hypothetical protein